VTLLRRARDRRGVDVVPDVGKEDVDGIRWAALARRVLEAEGVGGPTELSLSFVDEDTMSELNHEWMAGEGPTDVLSWAIDEPPAAGVAANAGPEQTVLLGDVVICPAVAGRNAASAQRDIADELALLVVHGVLHVLGDDHADPDQEAAMQAREDRHLTSFHDERWTRSPS
jgi:probable rRNA maturation factor